MPTTRVGASSCSVGPLDHRRRRAAPIARVSLTSADVADAVVTSSNQLLVNGKMPGTISMFVWERAGGLHRYEIVVQRDLARLNDQMKQLFPGESIDVQSNGKGIVLSGAGVEQGRRRQGRRPSPAATSTRRTMSSTCCSVQEGAGSNQVLLRVRFAEVSRSAITELGVDAVHQPDRHQEHHRPRHHAAVRQRRLRRSDLDQSERECGFGNDITSNAGKFTFSDFLNLFLFSEKYDLGAVIKALQTKGLFQSLAEPNLVAESGKEASFLAGGEFPMPIAQGGRQQRRHLASSTRNSASG